MNNYKYTRMLAYGERAWEWRFEIKQDKKHTNESPRALCGPVMLMPRTESALHTQGWQQHNVYKIVKFTKVYKIVKPQ